MNRFQIFIERLFFFLLRVIIGRDRRDRYVKKITMKRRSDNIKANGPEALRLFSEVVASENASYWLFWGTLLGACREHGFIDLDDDIDIGMFYTEMTESLVSKMEEKGFKCLYAIVDKELTGGMHFAFDFKNVKFDIYSFTVDSSEKKYSCFEPVPYNSQNTTTRSRKDIWEEIHYIFPAWSYLKEVSFEGIKTYIPSNSDELLKLIYGDDYMTPKPGYKGGDVNVDFKKHEDPQIKYACLMSFEMFKMLKQYVSF